MLVKELFMLDWNIVFSNMIIAVVLLVIGIFLGIILNWILKKISKKAKLHEARGYNFIKLFITIITWSIYILFLNLALVQLDIPVFTGWLTSILLVIPAITGALLLLGVGFAIATYLKGIIEESRIEDYRILSRIVWSFVMYIFGTYALKTALISIETKTTNYLLLILTAIIGTATAFYAIKKGR